MAAANPMTESAHPESRASRNPPPGRSRGFRLGRLFGVEIRLDFTLIIVFFLVATSLGNGTLPNWHPDWPPVLVWSVAIGAAVSFFVSVLLHELAHALVTKAQGTPVRGITLFMLGGMAQIEEEPSSPGREFAMAIVGPLTSIAIGLVCMFLGGLSLGVDPDMLPDHPREALQALGPLSTLVVWLGPLNLILGVFNLIPGFPLDGGRVLRSILWAMTGDQARASTWASFAGQLFGWLLTALGVLMLFGSVFPVVGGGFVQGIWFVMLGWYLAGAAGATATRVVVQRVLDGVPVGQLMLTRFETVEPELSLEPFVEEHLMRTEQRSFPVVSHRRFLGIASLADVRATPRSEWATKAVRDVMTPADRVGTIGADDPAARALDELARRDVDQLAVLDASGELVGLVGRRDIVQWLSIHDSREDRHGHGGAAPALRNA